MKKFEITYSEANNCGCGICFKLNHVMRVKWYTQDYASEKTGKICKNLQKHPHSLWVCRDCYRDLCDAIMDSAKLPNYEEWQDSIDKGATWHMKKEGV